MTQTSENKITLIDGVEYTPNDIMQMKRLRKETSEITFMKFRQATSLIKKHIEVDVGLVMKIK